MKEHLKSFLKLLKEQQEANEAESDSAESHDEMMAYQVIGDELEIKIDAVEKLLGLLGEEEEEEDEQHCKDCGIFTENEGEGLKEPNLCWDCEFEQWGKGTLPYKVSESYEALFKNMETLLQDIANPSKENK
jgi:hypothetical protein